MEHKTKIPAQTLIIVSICIAVLIVIGVMVACPTLLGSSEIVPASSPPTDKDGVIQMYNTSSDGATVPAGQTVSENMNGPEIFPVDDTCQQYIFAYCSGSSVTLTLYERVSGDWVEQMVVYGMCGMNGITYNKRDGDGKTPAGEFDLTFCYGISKPDTKLSFQWVDANTVWVNDPESEYYNTIQSTVILDAWKSAESLYNGYFSNGEHNYCINIAANGDGITPGSAAPGKGSLITICGKTTPLTKTQGCIDVSAEDMLSLLNLLDSSKNPEIIIY